MFWTFFYLSFFTLKSQTLYFLSQRNYHKIFFSNRVICHLLLISHRRLYVFESSVSLRKWWLFYFKIKVLFVAKICSPTWTELFLPVWIFLSKTKLRRQKSGSGRRKCLPKNNNKQTFDVDKLLPKKLLIVIPNVF